ncbi:MAG: PTS sugar transporter subunit IIA [Polyangiaceae bacterium]|nr:PTS sugar transporter subunit IIA [Polyangiaceae bacterium]
MRLSDILAEQRIVVDASGSVVPDKGAALQLLASLLAPAVELDPEVVERLLKDREELQSTGIGDGVAIPHASADAAVKQAAALLVCPRGVPFEAIDGQAVELVFGVVGPRRATGEHLRTLARISRLLRDDSTRHQLKHAASPIEAYNLIEAHDAE